MQILEKVCPLYDSIFGKEISGVATNSENDNDLLMEAVNSNSILFV